MYFRPLAIHYSDDEELVVHLHGRDEHGQRRHLRVHGTEPHFYVPADATISDHDHIKRVEPTRLRALDGTPVQRIVTYKPKDVPGVREHFDVTFEADVYFRDRVRYDLGIRDVINVNDENLELDSHGITPSLITPTDALQDPPNIAPRICCLDIETDDSQGFPDPREPSAPVVCVGVWDSFSGKYVEIYNGQLNVKQSSDAVTRIQRRGWDARIQEVPSEKQLFAVLAQYFAQVQPDIVVGWNVRDFDVEYLKRRAWRGGYSCPDWREVAVFDLMEAYKRQYKVAVGELEAKGLDYVATQIEGLEGKTTDEPIHVLRDRDPAKLIEYNLQDVALAKEIMRNNDLVDFFLSITSFCGTSLENALFETRLTDAWMFHRLHGETVLPTYEHTEKAEAYQGADVLDPEPGIHKNVCELDFHGHYANIVRTFNISPETRVDEDVDRGDDAELVDLPSGGRYATDRRGVFPEAVDDLLRRRQELRDEGKDKQQRVVKSVLLSIGYGVTGSEKSRFYSPDMAEDITGMAAHGLHFAEDIAQEMDCAAIYGDTDAVYVVGEGLDYDRAQTLTMGERLAQDINERLVGWSRDFGATACHMEVEVEQVYDAMFVAPRKKRYAAIYRVDDDDDADYRHDDKHYRLKDRGFETRRSDASQLAKDLQHAAFRILLLEGGKDDLVAQLREVVADIRDGSMEWTRCRIPTGLGKALDDYKVQSEHVKAAKWSNANLGTDFRQGDKPWLLFGHVEDLEPTDCIALRWDMDVPSGFVPDSDKIIERCVTKPLKHLLDALEIDPESLTAKTDDVSEWI